MKRHMLLNLDEGDIFYLKQIAAKKGLSASAYVRILVKTAVVYHNTIGKEELYEPEIGNEQSKGCKAI